MIIRKAVVTDIENLVSFQLAMASETENLALDAVILRNGILRLINSDSKGEYLVAETEDSIIGCCMLTYEWSDWRSATFIWLQSVYVLPQFRRQGVFSEFYKFVKSMVNNSDSYAGIRLYVDKQNSTAAHVYQQLGMMEEHYVMYGWVKK